MATMGKTLPKSPRGRKPGVRKPWQQHFWKRVVDTDGHWIWTGRKTGGTDKFTAYMPEFDMSRKFVCNAATWFAYFYKYGEPRPCRKGWRSTRLCGVDRCIHPDHWTDQAPEKVKPNAERDSEIISMWSNYLAWRRWNMANIGRKFGLSRERVRQIVAEASQ